MKKSFYTLAALLVSNQVVSAEETNLYLSYFDVYNVIDLAESVSLYNEENGYWNHEQILNKELVRYLATSAAGEISNEENGYWM